MPLSNCDLTGAGGSTGAGGGAAGGGDGALVCGGGGLSVAAASPPKQNMRVNMRVDRRAVRQQLRLNPVEADSATCSAARVGTGMWPSESMRVPDGARCARAGDGQPRSRRGMAAQAWRPWFGFIPVGHRSGTFCLPRDVKYLACAWTPPTRPPARISGPHTHIQHYSSRPSQVPTVGAERPEGKTKTPPSVGLRGAPTALSRRRPAERSTGEVSVGAGVEATRRRDAVLGGGDAVDEG